MIKKEITVTLDFCYNTFHGIVYCKHFLWTGHNTCLALQFLAISGSLAYMLQEILNTPVCLDFRSLISVYSHSTDLNMVEVHVLGKAAVLVNQKTEPSFLFKESFSAAFCNKSLNITLSRTHGFQILREKKNHIDPLSFIWCYIQLIKKTLKALEKAFGKAGWDRLYF